MRDGISRTCSQNSTIWGTVFIKRERLACFVLDVALCVQLPSPVNFALVEQVAIGVEFSFHLLQIDSLSQEGCVQQCVKFRLSRRTRTYVEIVHGVCHLKSKYHGWQILSWWHFFDHFYNFCPFYKGIKLIMAFKIHATNSPIFNWNFIQLKRLIGGKQASRNDDRLLTLTRSSFLAAQRALKVLEVIIYCKK